jgi:hypothetical protein
LCPNRSRNGLSQQASSFFQSDVLLIMVGPSKSRPPMSHRKSDLGIPCPLIICQSSASEGSFFVAAHRDCSWHGPTNSHPCTGPPLSGEQPTLVALRPVGRTVESDPQRSTAGPKSCNAASPLT